jgi:nitroreductase
MNEVMDTIFKRRSIRKFTDQPVEREKLELLLQAAMAAPTATNAQPWEFVVVTEAEVLEQLRNALPFAKMVAPAAICVLGSTRMQKNKAGHKFWVQDCSAATENILLAAVSLGLGAVWIGVHPVNMFIRSVEKILNLPEGVQPLNLIMLGYPAEEKENRTQYEEARVQWEAFPPSEKARKIPTGIFRKDEIELRE